MSFWFITFLVIVLIIVVFAAAFFSHVKAHGGFRITYSVDTVHPDDTFQPHDAYIITKHNLGGTIEFERFQYIGDINRWRKLLPLGSSSSYDVISRQTEIELNKILRDHLGES